MMKLTTPATASAPYTAAAPPEMISTRSMSAAGIVLTSTTAPAVEPMPRRPSISTRLRLMPRPRKSMKARPFELGLFDCELRPGTTCGIVLMYCSTVTKPLSRNASWSMVYIGLSATASRLAMRLPVTMTSSRVLSSSASVVCAIAGRPQTMPTAPVANSAMRMARASFFSIIFRLQFIYVCTSHG